MKCKFCGSELKDSDVYCGKCGNKYSSESYCKKCGKKVEDGNAFCSNCGEPVDNYEEVEIRTQTQNTQQPQANETPTIGILAIVFGALGGILGLIFSIIGLSLYTTPTYRTYCKIGLWLVVGWALITIIVSATTSCAASSYHSYY